MGNLAGVEFDENHEVDCPHCGDKWHGRDALQHIHNCASKTPAERAAAIKNRVLLFERQRIQGQNPSGGNYPVPPWSTFKSDSDSESNSCMMCDGGSTRYDGGSTMS